MTTTEERGTRRAALSTAELPPVDPSIPPWPGELVRLSAAEVFVRRTPGPAVRPGGHGEASSAGFAGRRSQSGPGAGGEPALYVHGLGGASTNWTDLAGLLSGWLDAEALDLPGFGYSDPPARRDYSLTAQARVVSELIERRDRGPVHLFGNSMGGAISLLLAATRPDLVATLTLVSPAMPDLRLRRGSDPTVPLMLLPGVDRLVARRISRLAPEARTRALIELCYADPSRLAPNRLAEAVAEVEARRQQPWAMDALARAMRGLAAAYLVRGPRSMWRLAAAVTAPSLVIWGDQDKLVNAALAPRTARAIPDARLLVLRGIGHTAQLEDPETVARAFLGLREELSG